MKRPTPPRGQALVEINWRPDYWIDWNHPEGPCIRDGHNKIVVKNPVIRESDLERLIAGGIPEAWKQ